MLVSLFTIARLQRIAMSSDSNNEEHQDSQDILARLMRRRTADNISLTDTGNQNVSQAKYYKNQKNLKRGQPEVTENHGNALHDDHTTIPDVEPSNGEESVSIASSPNQSQEIDENNSAEEEGESVPGLVEVETCFLDLWLVKFKLQHSISWDAITTLSKAFSYLSSTDVSTSKYRLIKSVMNDISYSQSQFFFATNVTIHLLITQMSCVSVVVQLKKMIT